VGKRSLADIVYDKELDRMRMLKGFPELPAVRREMTRTLRSITAVDGQFLHNLITHFVDHWESCPKPHDLTERAGAMRSGLKKPLGSASCLKCGGTGWVQSTRTVKVHGFEPYEADFSEHCACAPPLPRQEAS
jgi:hypothetical protein